MEKECFRKRFYTYYIKINIRSFFPDLIIILNNKGIDKSFPPSFYTDVVMENKNTENIKNKKNLKDF